MDGFRMSLVRVSNWINRELIWFVLGSYAVAAVWPDFGLWIRDLNLGEYDLLHEETLVTLPMVMLALLLFNAGMGARPSQLRQLFRNPLLLVAGLVANLLIPVAFILVVTFGMRAWHNPDEVQNILLGLALVASMPIA